VAFNAGTLLIGLRHLLAPQPSPIAIKDSPITRAHAAARNAREAFFGEILPVAMCSSCSTSRRCPDPLGHDLFGGRGGDRGGRPSTGFLLVEMLVLCFILAVGYVYVWKRGALRRGIDREGLPS